MGAYLAAVLLGGLFGLIVVMAVIRFVGPGKLPEVTAEMLAAARDKWKSAGVTDYDIEVAVSGRQPSTYSLQVREGIVVDAKRDSQPLKQQRTFGTWSVEGMWETIDRDLAAVEQVRVGQSPPGSPQLLLRGEFDPELGYPRRYQRTEVYKFSANQEVSWEVRMFERK